MEGNPIMLRKRGKIWHVQLKVNGKPWNRSTGETDLARARLAEKRILLEARLLRGQSPESLSLDQAIISELKRIESDVSRRAAERADYCFQSFQHWLGKDISLPRIDMAMLERFQRARLAQVSRSTVDKEVCALVRLLKQHGIPAERPKAKPGMATEQREFTQDELTLFFSHCPEEHKTLFLTMLATGARPAELIPSTRSGHVALLKSEVNTESGVITIRGAKARPGTKARLRVVAVPEELLERLARQAKGTKGHHVFAGFTNLHRIFDKILVAAGIAQLEKVRDNDGKLIRKVVHKQDPLGRKLTAHSFRHTYATRMAQEIGGNPFLLKQILGHTQISTTDRYIHPVGDTPTVRIIEFLSGGMDVKDGCQDKEKAAS
jgi:integrase